MTRLPGLVGGLVVVLAAAAFPFPYLFRNWWRFLPETALLLLAVRVYAPDDWRRRAGLVGSFLPALLVFAGTAAVALVAVPWIAARQGLTIVSGSGYFLRPVFPVFQALNEEIAFRGLPLLGLGVAARHPRFASVLAATAFALAHAVFYPLSQGGALAPTTLLVLFLAAIGLNGWCLARRSIAIPWAIHAGWNVGLFGMGDYATSQARFFDALVGHPATLAIAAVLAVSGLIAAGREGSSA